MEEGNLHRAWLPALVSYMTNTNGSDGV